MFERNYDRILEPSMVEPILSKSIIPTPLKIGFLGLGIMGSGMVSNLLRSGHEVTVWNRTPSKVYHMLFDVFYYALQGICWLLVIWKSAYEAFVLINRMGTSKTGIVAFFLISLTSRINLRNILVTFFVLCTYSFLRMTLTTYNIKRCIWLNHSLERSFLRSKGKNLAHLHFKPFSQETVQ